MALNAIQEAYDQNRARQRAWFLPTDTIDPAAADDYFVYVKNDSVVVYTVHRASYETTVAGTIEFHHVTGTAGGSPTPRTPVNLTLGGGPGPKITFSDDPDITGLTSQGQVARMAMGVASVQQELEIPEGIRIQPGTALALLWDTATGILSGGLYIHEEP